MFKTILRLFTPEMIVKYYPLHAGIQMKIDKKYFNYLGYKIKSKDVVNKRSLGKTIGLGILFLPLALFGKSDRVKIIYERVEK